MTNEKYEPKPRLYVTPEYWGTRPGYAVVDSNDFHLVKWFPVEELAEAERFAKEGILMKIYEIFSVYDASAEAIAVVSADSEIDALARFAVAEGFADPREAAQEHPEMDFFCRHPHTNRLSMIYANDELAARAVGVKVVTS